MKCNSHSVVACPRSRCGSCPTTSSRGCACARPRMGDPWKPKHARSWSRRWSRRSQGRSGLGRGPDRAGRRRAQMIEDISRVLAESSPALPFADGCAPAYAELIADRTRAGRPISTMDALVAAVTKVHGASIATRDVAGFTGWCVSASRPGATMRRRSVESRGGCAPRSGHLGVSRLGHPDPPARDGRAGRGSGVDTGRVLGSRPTRVPSLLTLLTLVTATAGCIESGSSW